MREQSIGVELFLNQRNNMYYPEVQIRRLCSIQECDKGKIWTSSAKRSWEACSNCDGTGYITEWCDLRDLIKELIF